MFAFYVTAEALSKMVLAGSDEYEILKLQNCVYVELDDSKIAVYRDEYRSDAFSESNIIMELESSDCVIKHSDAIMEVKNNPDSLSNYADCVFIVDKNEQWAKNVTAQYGVLVLSQDKIDLSSLVLHDYYTCVKQEKGIWDEVLEKIRTVPFNTILINDRNLFSDIYKNGEETHRFGVDNLKSILNSMVTFRRPCVNMPIHVFVGFDLDAEKQNFSKINKEFRRSFSDIIDNSNIIIELVAYQTSSSFWEDSHNRWIVTNYGCFTFDHKISIFQKDNKACVDQDINYHSLYAMGIKDHNPAKLPKRSRDVKIQRIKSIFVDVLKRPNDYKYSINGEIDTPNKIQNRLLVS
jgi:hypothetical protein